MVVYPRGQYWIQCRSTSLLTICVMWQSTASASLHMTQKPEDWLVGQRVALPSRGTSTGWRNMSQQEHHEVHQGEVQKSAPGEEQPQSPVHAGAHAAVKQLGRKQPGVLLDTKFKTSQQHALAAKVASGVRGCIRESIASRWRDPAPLLGTGEVTPGVLSPLLGSSIQMKHGHTGKHTAKGYGNDKERLRELGLFSQQKRRVRGISSMCRNI